MQESFKDIELIDDYLNGLLDQDGIALVEDRLKSDGQFRDLYQKNSFLNEAVLDLGLIEIRDKMKVDLSRSSFNWKLWLVMAVLFSAVSISAYVFIFKTERKTLSVVSFVKQNEISSKQTEHEAEHGKNTTKNKSDKSSIKKEDTKKDEEIVESANTQESDLREGQKEKVSGQIEKDKDKDKDKDKETQNLVVIDPCLNFGNDIQLKSFAACSGESNGSIVLSGDLKNKFFSIGHGDFISTSVFDNLSKGLYKIKVKNEAGCAAEMTATVTEKNCILNKDYSFQMSLQTIEFTTKTEGEKEIVIMTKSGVVIFNKKFFGTTYEWNGLMNNGNMVTPDTYGYYVSESHNKIMQGLINVLE